VVTQHKLVVADFRFKICLQLNKHNKLTRTKWWKLKGEADQTFKERVIEEGHWAEERDTNIMWRKMATCIRKIASEEFGLSQGNIREVKDTWWWNEDVQKAIKEKKDCYKHLHHDKCADNIEKYKIAKKSAKRAVSRARGQAYDDLYQRLDTKQGEKDIYRTNFPAKTLPYNLLLAAYASAQVTPYRFRERMKADKFSPSKSQIEQLKQLDSL
jgi:hypothetical protein